MKTYEVSIEFAEELKKQYYVGGKYQDKDTLAIIYPLSSGSYIFAAVPGRNNFILNSELELKAFKDLIKPKIDLRSENVYIRMQSYTFSILNNNLNTMDLLIQELGNSFELQFENEFPKNLDEVIKARISQTKNQIELSNLFFLLGIYFGEVLNLTPEFNWKVKLKHGVPQYLIPQIFKDGNRNKIGLWPIIFRDIRNKRLKPIEQLMKRLTR